MKLKFLTSLLCLSLIMACHSQQAGLVETVTANQFAYELKQSTNPQLLDVRTAEEYNGQHIEGAQNLDWNAANFEAQVQKLDPTKPVFVYCLSEGSIYGHYS